MAPFEQGGVENEEATELAGFGGIGPNGGLWVEDQAPTDPPPPAVPGPVFVTIIEPATTRAITFALTFSKSITISHFGTDAIAISINDAFPAPTESLPEPGSAGEPEAV